MKKLTAVILAAVIALSFASCGSKENADDTAKEKDTEATSNPDIAGDIIGELTPDKPVDIPKTVDISEQDLTWEEADNGAVITAYTGSETAIRIPDTVGGIPVISIGESTFENSSLLVIELPDTVETIEKKAFYYSTNLLSVKLGNNTIEIKDKAFDGCVSLSKIELGKKIKTIGWMAFAACASLTKISLPQSVEMIGNGAFVMSGLTSIKIPETVTTLGEGCFQTCKSLKTVVIGDGISKLPRKGFEACTSLETVTIPDTVTDIGTYCFRDCVNVVLTVPSGSAAEAYAIDNGISYVNK